MNYTEHFFKADATVQLKEGLRGKATWRHMKDGVVTVFRCLSDLVSYHVLGDKTVDHFIIDEFEWDSLDESDAGSYEECIAEIEKIRKDR